MWKLKQAKVPVLPESILRRPTFVQQAAAAVAVAAAVGLQLMQRRPTGMGIMVRIRLLVTLILEASLCFKTSSSQNI